MRVPWTARRSNQTILKEINPEYSLDELMLKLKLQYFGHLRQRTNSFEKTLVLGKIEGRRRGRQRTQWLDDNTNSMDVSLSKQGSLACCSPWGHKELDTTEQPNEESIQSAPHLQAGIGGGGMGCSMTPFSTWLSYNMAQYSAIPLGYHLS